MRFFAFTALLLLLPAFALAAPPPNPADYPLTVHIISSFFTAAPVSTSNSEVLEVTTGGRHLQLTTTFGGFIGPLVPADYHATMTPGKALNGYDDNETFTLLLPDGKTRTFYLSGILPAVAP